MTNKNGSVDSTIDNSTNKTWLKKKNIKHGEHGSLMIKHRDLIDINSGIDGDASCGLDGNI